MPLRPLISGTLCAAGLLMAPALTGCGGYGKAIKKGDAYLASGRYPAAVRTYEDALEIRQGDPRALLGMAEAWIGAGEPERAIVPAQVAAETEPATAASVIVRAMIDAGRGADAIETAESLARDRPSDPGAHSLLARTHLAASDLGGATDAAEKSIALSGGPAHQTLAAWIHLRNGNNERALSLATKAAGMALDDHRVQAEAAAVFRLAGDREKAQAAAAESRSNPVLDPPAWARRAQKLSAGGDEEGAAFDMACARAVDPEEGRFAFQLGVHLVNIGELTRGIFELEQALVLAPYSTGQNRGGVAVLDRRSESLSPEQRRAVRSTIYRTLTDVRGRLGDPTAAAEARQAAMVEDPNTTSQDWTDLARLWEAAGDWTRTIKAANQAVDMDQRNAVAQHRLARAYAAIGDMNRSIGHARLAWQLSPGSADVALLLGALYEKRGETRPASQVYRTALERNPKDPRLKEAAARTGP